MLVEFSHDVAIPHTMDSTAELNSLPPLGKLKDLDEQIRSDLASAGKFESVEVGAYLARQGQDHHALSVILSGKVSVSCHAHGDYIRLATLGPGETVGEMNIIDPHKASADVAVVERARIWTITEQEFESLVERDPRTGYRILKFLGRQLCRRLRTSSEQMLRQAEATRNYFLDQDY